MKKSDFYFDLPEELIAQEPPKNRTDSRLLKLDRRTGEITHTRFPELINYLNPGDCLVLNDTRVLPARLIGTKIPTGAHVEFLLLKNMGNDVWEAMAGPARRAKKGSEFTFGNDIMRGVVEEELDNGNRLIKLIYDGIFLEVLERIGEIPLPPYIKKKLEDSERYQTVYSKKLGSAAAPTAGLHFTEEMLREIEKKGVKLAYITLHIGIGTFRPVKAENIEDHKMHFESYTISEKAAEIINSTRDNGGRVISVGTTSCRTLESNSDERGYVTPCSAETDIFIYPGYKFKCIDGLITNFHLPESTLIMLVAAFCGRENTLRAYNEAVKERYRFFSFGDAMFII